MQSMLKSALECVVGALTTEVAEGVTFHRTPAAARAQMGDPFLTYHSSVSSGIRIDAVTDCRALELDVEIRHIVVPGVPSKGAAFDLVIDSELREPVWTDQERLMLMDPVTRSLALQPPRRVTLRFNLGNLSSERRIEVWFPANSAVTLFDIRTIDGSYLRPAATTKPIWVHHGSSISQCSEVSQPTETWPAIVARATGRSLVNLGIGGQCQLDQFMARSIRDHPATAISLELGINVINGDTMRERAFIPAFHGFLDTVRDGHPETPILIASPIICPIAEDRPGPTLLGGDGIGYTPERPMELSQGALTLTRVREVLRDHVKIRLEQGDQRIAIIDGLSLFGQNDIHDLPDGLHPNAAGYRRIAQRFLELTWGQGWPG